VMSVNLGLMYHIGNGVPKDYISAYAWFNLAAANGSETAVSSRDTLERMMTPDQIEKAQALTREFSRKYPGKSPASLALPGVETVPASR
ncbi:MAG: SEL1-like repeat protein, partial [Magnetococcus sp. DMHC-1]